MWIKNYTATSVREALARIKDEMGPGAVILDTRVERGITSRSGGPGSQVTVTAASEQPGVPGKKNRIAEHDGPKTLRLKGKTAVVAATEPESDESTPGQVAATKETREALPAGDTADPVIADPDRLERIEQSIAEIGGVIHSLGSANRFSRWIDAPEVRPWLQRHDELRTELSAAYTGHLLDAMPDPDPFLSRDRLPAAVLFVGPAGSGKSTLLMKSLAVWWRSHQATLPVLEITGRDAAAGGPLDSWAHLFDLTHKRCTFGDKAEISHFLTEVDGESMFVRCDLPTADEGGEKKLKKLQKQIGARIVVLVLSSLVRQEVNERFVRRYAQFNPTHLAFTGFDEVAAFDDARHLSTVSGLPLAYFTTGVAPCDEIEPFTNNLLRTRIAAEIGTAVPVAAALKRDSAKQES